MRRVEITIRVALDEHYIKEMAARRRESPQRTVRRICEALEARAHDAVRFHGAIDQGERIVTASVIRDDDSAGAGTPPSHPGP